MPDFGFKRKLQFKMAKNNKDFEQTVMTDEFHSQKEAFEEYDKLLGHLVYRLEHVVQPNDAVLNLPEGPIQYPQGEDPLDKLNKALTNYRNVVKGLRDVKTVQVHKVTLAKMGENAQTAAAYRGSMQKNHRQVISHMRKFHVTTFKQYQDKWTQFEAARDKMDLARHEVKQAKTTTEIEKRAVHYQEAVEQFDTQCTVTLEELPTLQKAHGQDLKEWINTHRTYHYQMSKYL